MNWFIAFQIVTTWHFRFFFGYSYFFIIRTVWMCHGCLTLPAIFLFNLSMFRLFHCHWLKCVTIRTELCDLGILTVYYLIHSFWLPLMIFFIKPRRGIGFLRPVQSVPITNKVVSSSPVHGEVYSIQHYVIKFGSDLQGRWFSPLSSTNKTDHHDIAKILLKVALNTPSQPNQRSALNWQNAVSIHQVECQVWPSYIKFII